MTEDTSTPLQEPLPARPRVVVIVSQGPVFSTDIESIAGRSVAHVSINMSDQPLTSMASTIATGVDPIMHGITTRVLIEPDDLSRRTPEPGDCLYPCFWKDAAEVGLRTILLDWPVTGGDAVLHDSLSPEQAASSATLHPGIEEDIVSLHLKGEATVDRIEAFTHLLARLDIVLSAAGETLTSSDPPDLFGIVLRSAPWLISARSMLGMIGVRINELLAPLPASTIVLIVHNQEDIGNDQEVVNPWTLSIIGGEVIPQEKQQLINLRAIGGAIRLLAGVPCPKGVSLPRWPFLSLPEISEGDRPIPSGVKEDATDWDDLVDRVLAMPDDEGVKFDREQNIEVLVKRFNTLALNSIHGNNWTDLERHGDRLVRLRGMPVHHWWYIYSLDRLGKKNELQAAVADLVAAYPGLPITLITESILLVQSATAEAADKLKAIDPRQLKIETALGTLGRLCLRSGLEEQGLDAIRLALQKRLAIPDDRTDAAQCFLQRQQPEDAMQVMGSLGKGLENRGRCILRLRILLALGDREAAEHHAAMILDQYPGDRKVLELMGA